MANNKLQIILEMLYKKKGLQDADRDTQRHAGFVTRTLKAAYQTVQKSAESAFKAIGNSMESLARTTRNFAIGTGVAMAASVREFYTWNKEAARAWTMMDAGIGEFSKFRKEIAKLSPELGVAKAELGKGWYQALSAGVSKNNLIPFLRTAGQVAVADGSRIETAIDGITTVLNAFKIDASNVESVADKMFKTVANGKVTFEQLAQYISAAAPVASSFGVSIDEILAATATLTKQGINPATALTELRNVMGKLNEELGDGWRKTNTFQAALEAVAKKANYSGTALTEMFGLENISGVLGLVGSNARNAASDLREMNSSVGTLAKAFAKVDSQTGHWPKIWQTIRAYVSDFGQVIDERIRPAINYLQKVFESFRNSDAFSNFLTSFGEKFSAVFEGMIAGLQTFFDMLSKASLGGLISGTVVALVDLAITLLAEGLKSLGTVMIALAKIFSAALAADFMRMDIWGRDEQKNAQNAALKRLKELSPEQADALGVPRDFLNSDGLRSPEQQAAREKEMLSWARGLSLEQATNIATSSRDTDIDAAITQAFNRFSASKENIQAAGPRILDKLSDRTGLDVRALYAQNRGEVHDLLNRVQEETNKIPEPTPSQASQPEASAPDTATPPAKSTKRAIVKRPRCAAQTEYGTQCTQLALPGKKYCRRHEFGDSAPTDFAAKGANRGWSTSSSDYEKAQGLAGRAGEKGKGKKSGSGASSDETLRKAGDEISTYGQVTNETVMLLIQKIETQSKAMKDSKERAKQIGG